MPVKIAKKKLHPCEEVLRQDSDTLPSGMGRHNLTPYGGDFLVFGYPTGTADADPLEGRDSSSGNAQAQGRVLGCGAGGVFPDDD